MSEDAYEVVVGDTASAELGDLSPSAVRRSVLSSNGGVLVLWRGQMQGWL